MKIRAIKKAYPLNVASRVSRLTRVEFDRHPYTALLKEPAHFWAEVHIANEAYILGEVSHPFVRRKLAYDAASHQLFLEFIEAETLDDLVRKGVTRADPQRTHHLLQSLAETMADLHAGNFCGRPLVHNDVKSRNVLIPATAPDEIRLIDFSYSFFSGNLPPFINDKTQNPAGTAQYMAPEKWDNDYTRPFAGDVFSFGVMAYYACTGMYPFDGTMPQIERGICEGKPPPLLKPGHNLLRNTALVIMSCLEKDPARRPTMDRVARAYADSARLLR